MVYDIFTILPLMACLFWTAVLVLSWHRNSAAQHLLTLFMGVSAMLYFCHFIFFNLKGTVVTVANCVYTFCNLAVFPMYYLYICRLTSTRRVSAKQWMLLLPAAIICLWATVHYIFMPGCDCDEDVRLLISKLVFAIEAVAVVVMGNNKLRAFDTKLEDYYSNTEVRSVKQTQDMIIVLLLGTAVSMVASYIGREYFSQNSMLLGIPSVVFTVLLFAVGYVGMMQRFCADDLEREISEMDAPESIKEIIAKGYAEPALQSAADGAEDVNNESALMETLDALMEEEKLYLQPDLRLVDVAQRLGIGRTVVSALINRHGGLSFSDYVNVFRVRHAQKMIEDGCDFTMVAVGEKSGFLSENSFYRAFRKQTGMTPGQWQKKIICNSDKKRLNL